MPLGWGQLMTGVGGAAGAAAGFPWALLPIAISLLGSIFGESEEDKKSKELEEMAALMKQMGINPPYQSPYLKKMDPIVAQALASQMKRTSNWGWPEGKGMDTSFLDQFLQSMQGGGLSGALSGGLPGTIRSGLLPGQLRAR